VPTPVPRLWVSEIHVISRKRLSKIETADDLADGAGDEQSLAFRWMRQRTSHPPFVVKIEAYLEIG
jgi:hypothetical protein